MSFITDLFKPPEVNLPQILPASKPAAPELKPLAAAESPEATISKDRSQFKTRKAASGLSSLFVPLMGKALSIPEVT